MKETGIVRRIDELGRVVIPKEIRKTLKLNEGDPLEIYTDRDELLFRKYSPLGSWGDLGAAVVESLNYFTDHTAILCDTDRVIAVKGYGWKDFEEMEITKTLLECLKERKVVVRGRGENSKIPIINGETKDYAAELIVPIVSDSDLIGGLILLSKNDEIEGKALNVSTFAADLVSRQV